MIDIKDFLPRTQADRYNHALLEQLIELNKKLDAIVPKPEPISDLSVATVQEKPKRKRGGKNDSKEA